MDFALTPQQEEIRRELRAFLDAEVPPDHPEAHIMPESGTDEEFEFAVDFTRRFAEAGWYTAPWPEEFGGKGFGPIETLILREELSSRGVITANTMAAQIAGLLMEYGNEEQRERLLPAIARCEAFWGEGYSEPEAGSDLAALTTTARKDGDEYVIDGTKIWTTGGHRLDGMYLFARTDPDVPKHRGISYILVELKRPGVSIEPLPNLSGVANFAQETFEGVRVPVANLLGEENTGWRQRGTGPSIGIEGLPDKHSKISRHLQRLTDHWRDTPAHRRTPEGNVLVRHKLAALATEVEVARNLAWRNASLQDKGEMTATAGEAQGIFVRELNQRAANTAVAILGLYGPLLPEDDRAQVGGWYAMSYMLTLASTLHGGTTEIHRNILAWVGLGMPRAR